MITVALSASVGAPHERVWRALVDPSERALWDDRILGTVATASTRRHARPNARAPNRPASIQTTSWRFKLGEIPLVLKDEILRADRHSRLVSRLAIGSMRFDQTLTFHVEDDETGPRTRVGLKIVATNSIVVIGEVIPRLEVQKLVMEYVDATLRQVRKHCEADA